MKPEEIFAIGKEIKLLENLFKASLKAQIVCDRSYFDFLWPKFERQNINSDFMLTKMELGSVTDLQKSQVIVCSSENERQIVDKLKLTPSQNQIIGLFDDFLSSRISFQDPLARDKCNNVETIYGLICTPRSGSTHLCDILQNFQLGKPIEHLRKPLLQILERLPDIKQKINYISAIANAGQQNQIFGTKLISHFWFDFINLLNEDEKKYIYQLLQNSKIIYLFRSDKILQAISLTYAKSGNFHALTEDKAQEIRGSFGEYNYSLIKRNYLKLLREEKQLCQQLSCLNNENIILVMYESELEANIEKTISIIIKNIFGSSENIPIEKWKSRHKKLRGSKNEEFALRFCSDYQKDTGVDCERYFYPLFSNKQWILKSRIEI